MFSKQVILIHLTVNYFSKSGIHKSETKKCLPLRIIEHYQCTIRQCNINTVYSWFAVCCILFSFYLSLYSSIVIFVTRRVESASIFVIKMTYKAYKYSIIEIVTQLLILYINLMLYSKCNKCGITKYWTVTLEWWDMRV